MNTGKGIHDGHRKRMMEKVLNNCDGMPDHELLEVLLFGAIPRKNTNEIAHILLSKFGSLNNVLCADASSLEAVNGIGRATAGYLVTIGQIIKRMSERKDEPVFLRSFADVKKEVWERFVNEKQEKFLVFLLNKNYKLLATSEFTDESLNKVSAEVPEVANALSIFKPAHVIIAHNHLSGIAKPSEQDDDATTQISLLCDLHGAVLSDHVIFTNTDVFSYKNEGKLDDIKRKANIHKYINNVKEK